MTDPKQTHLIFDYDGKHIGTIGIFEEGINPDFVAGAVFIPKEWLEDLDTTDQDIIHQIRVNRAKREQL